MSVWIAGLLGHAFLHVCLFYQSFLPLCMPVLSASLSACHCMSAYLISVFKCVCLPACVLVSLSACMPFSVCSCACLLVPVYLPLCLPVCVLTCLPVCLSACLFVCLSVCLPASLPFFLPMYVYVCLSVHPSTYLFAYLPCLSRCLSVSVSVYRNNKSVFICTYYILFCCK